MDHDKPTGIYGATLRGIEGQIVEICARKAGALPMLKITGLASATEREARVRVQAALAAAGADLEGWVEIECKASGAAISGTGLDLPIAMVLAQGTGSRASVGAVGELSLAGEVRPVRGVLSAVEALSRVTSIVIVAPENAAEARLVEGVDVIPARMLRDAIAIMKDPTSHAQRVLRTSAMSTDPKSSSRGLDVPSEATSIFSPTADAPAGKWGSRRAALPPPGEQRSCAPRAARAQGGSVRFQPRACRMLEIAAAGGHSALLIGGPGTGKTMLARRLSGLLPKMTDDEALSVTRVHSAAGLNIGGGLISARPFRAPHHSTTPSGLVGGGAALPRPGEVSLAHNGVLFLDELPEFARATLEVLHEPLISGEVVLSRASGTLRYPSRCVVVASMLPCPCGHHGTPRCRCTADATKRYIGRIPQRLLDLFDARVRVEPLDVARIEETPPGVTTADVSMRVARAKAAADVITVEPVALASLNRAVTSLADRDRALRVGRTIARLDGANVVTLTHMTEAISFALGVAQLL